LEYIEGGHRGCGESESKNAEVIDPNQNVVEGEVEKNSR
jgi:hypothetical protein